MTRLRKEADNFQRPERGDRERLAQAKAMLHIMWDKARVGFGGTRHCRTVASLLAAAARPFSDLAGAVRQAADELAEVGLLREDKDSIRRGRRVQIYRKVPWDELTDDAQNEAVRLQIPLRIFRDGGNRPARG